MGNNRKNCHFSADRRPPFSYQHNQPEKIFFLELEADLMRRDFRERHPPKILENKISCVVSLDDVFPYFLISMSLAYL